MSNTLILKVYRSGKSRQISVAKLFPSDWLAVAAKVIERSEDSITVRFECIYKEGEE